MHNQQKNEENQYQPYLRSWTRSDNSSSKFLHFTMLRRCWPGRHLLASTKVTCGGTVRERELSWLTISTIKPKKTFCWNKPVTFYRHIWMYAVKML